MQDTAVVLFAAAIAFVALNVEATGFLMHPPPRRYFGRGGRPWMRNFQWDRYQQMAIEDLPEELPEYDMYCRGVPYDQSTADVQEYQPGGEIKMEWDIQQPEGGSCSINLVCPGRQMKQTLWRGPCGQSPGRAQCQAMLPRSFGCSPGECYVSWYYETENNRRYCNCVDIAVQPEQPSAPQPDTPPTAVTDSVPDMTTDTFMLTLTSAELSIVTGFVTLTSTSILELPGTTLFTGGLRTDIPMGPPMYQTMAPTSTEAPKQEQPGMPLGQPTTCIQDTIIVTYVQTETSTATVTETTTCTETSTVPVDRYITMFSTTTCTESTTAYMTILVTMPTTETQTSFATLPPETQTVYMTSAETSVMTTTVFVPQVTGQVEGTGKESMVIPTAPVYYTGAPAANQELTTANLPRAKAKYY